MSVARRLAVGRLVSLGGGSAAYIALVAAIFGETRSALWVSAAIFSSVVASVASALLGPLLGGAVLALGAWPAAVFVVDAGTFLLSAALVATVRHPFGRGSTEGEHRGALAGARLIARDPALRVPVLAGMVSPLGIGIVDVASYPLSLELSGGSAAYGAMTALLGGGGLLGAGLAGRVLRGEPGRVLVAGFLVGAVGLAVAGSAPMIAITLVGTAVAGSGRGLGDVATVTLVQARAVDAVRSRVFAAQDGAAHLAFSVSALTGGVLVTATGPRGAFAAATALGTGAAILACCAYAMTRTRDVVA